MCHDGGLERRSIISVLRITSSNRNGFFFFFLREGCNKTIVLKIELNN